jgi:hypothetical protein
MEEHMGRALLTGIGSLVFIISAFACGAHGTEASEGSGSLCGQPGALCPPPTHGTGGAISVSTSSHSSSTGSPPSIPGGLSCPTNYCPLGNGGYEFVYADGDPPSKTPTGASHATLVNGELCMSGYVMALPINPTQTDFQNDWGCGIGVNLDQAMGTSVINPFSLTGSGVIVWTTGVPPCTTARVVLTVGGVDYCAPLTDGVPIPWASFNTKCWDDTGTPLWGPPSSTDIKVQFVASTTACAFSSFCVTNILL